MSVLDIDKRLLAIYEGEYGEQSTVKSLPDGTDEYSEYARWLLERSQSWRNFTFMELGMFLSKVVPSPSPADDWVSLSELHKALGGYENGERDAWIEAELKEQ